MFSTAYKFIRFEKAKSLGILLAIIISIYLIGLELGIFFYLSSLIGGIVNNANPEYAQVFVVNKRTNNANQLAPFDIRWVNQLRSVPDVDGAYGIIMTNVSVKFPNGYNSPAMVIGSDYPEMAAGPSAKLLNSGSMQDLVDPYTVSADFYDNRAFHYDVKKGTTFEINGKRATVGVTTKNAKGFSAPLLYTTASKARFFSGFSESLVNGVIITVHDPLKIDRVVERINSIAPDLQAWRTEDLGRATVINVMTANNMGMSFGTLVIFAIISGFFIIGLTMYSATYDRIKDYGTLKAIGATRTYITRLVITQSFLYSIVGFTISLIMLTGTKYGMAKAGLIIRLTPFFLLFLFLVTLFIAVGSSFFSTSKLKNVEPSSVFR
ncbi:MAG TPA: ABC transporter permease [Bacteroidales bacterium]|nr:ABC transporter permease [Bacteroidales bacterium]HPT20545.1 ABC transporter permease [Bacteroidales bacterium]